MADRSVHAAVPAGTTAVIADEHPLWLEALESLLERLDLQVVARTSHPQQTEQSITEHRPDMLVVDYSILADAGISGVNGSSRLTMLGRTVDEIPGVKCVVLSERDDPDQRTLAFASGADAFCVKRAQPDDLIAAIRQIFSPSIYFAHSASARRAEPASVDALDEPVAATLTPREVEILRLAAEGHSNSQLARMLWVTEQTVKFHLSNVYRKLNVANRTEASRWAQVHGLLSAEVTAEPN